MTNRKDSSAEKDAEFEAMDEDMFLSEGRIVSVARQLMETSGVESVTMRRVAGALGVTAMALYHHVADKQALLALVADSVIALVPEPEANSGPWHERLREGFLAVHNETIRYPGLGPYVWRLHGFHPSGLRKLRSTLQLLQEAGFDEKEALTATYVLLAYGGGYFLMEQSIGRPAATSAPDKEDLDRVSKLYEKADLISEEAFVRGLDMVIAGLRAQLDAKTSALAASPSSAR